MNIDERISIPGLVPTGRGRLALTGHEKKVVASVWTHNEPEYHWFIVMIRVHPALRGQGLARKVLELIIAEADRQGVPLRLTVEPTRPVGLDYEQLVTWYRRYGFVFVPEYDGYMMERKAPSVP